MEQTKECNYAKQFIQHIKGGDCRFIEGKLRGFCKIVSAFRPGGSLDRQVNLSLRVPAQMGWRETEHKGKTAARIIPCPRGVALVVGVTSVRERGRESEPVRRLVLPRDLLA